MRKVVRWIGVVVGVSLLLIVIGSVVLMSVVDEDMLEARMESALGRQVSFERVDVGLFSFVSGVGVDDLRVSEPKSPEELERLAGASVPESELFASVDRLELRFEILPLLTGTVRIGEFLLHGPVINIVRHGDGTFNFSDLIGETATALPARRVGRMHGVNRAGIGTLLAAAARDVPLAFSIDRIGLDGGSITFEDRVLGKTFEIYDCSVIAHSIDVDPQDLERKNTADIEVEFGIKPVGEFGSRTVEYFDIGLGGSGTVKPFDTETGVLEPEVLFSGGSPYGTLTGLQIFEAIRSVPVLEIYTDRLAFLQREITWEDGEVEFWYRDGRVGFEKLELPTEKYLLGLDGSMLVAARAVDLTLGLALDEGLTGTVRNTVRASVEKNLPAHITRVVSSDRIADTVMDRLVNDEGRIYLEFHVTGTTGAPGSELNEPSIPSPAELARDLGRDGEGKARETAEEKGEEALEKAGDELEGRMEDFP